MQIASKISVIVNLLLVLKKKKLVSKRFRAVSDQERGPGEKWRE